jgi:hypothetical protein
VTPFDAALTLADLWLRRAGASKILIRDEEGATRVYSASGGEELLR